MDKQQVLDFYEDVVIINDPSLIPDRRREVGTIKILKSDFHPSPCGWIERLTAATLEARKFGGNLILIDKVSGSINLMMNSCGEISGYVFNVDESVVNTLKRNRVNGGLKNKYDFARIVFIKPAFTSNYSIYVNEDNLGLVKAGEIVEYKTKRKEPVVIWARTQRRAELILNVEPGYDYFILCNEEATGFGLSEVQFVTLQPEIAIDLINRMKR
ncbi:MAG: hypothetical protein ACK4KT_06120 [Thermaurantimonas sp.]